MLFPKSMLKQKTPRSKLESSTLRGFAGGWNAVDDDMSMHPRYAVALRNLYRTPSGAQAIRFGQTWFADIKSVRNEPIVDIIYFNNRNVVVTTGGHVLTISDAGTIVEIWNTAIALLLPGAPTAWSGSLTLVSFVSFKSSLIIHNGIDKPIILDSSFAVTYLQDLGTGSNVNVPIGRFGCIAANFHCVAGIEDSDTEIFISAVGTAGTFVGDPDPNDSISIDVGAYAPEGAAAIRGIAGFRSYLLVFLQEITLQVKLGVYDTDGNHKPEFPDTFPKFGLIGSRCITTIENDLIFAGLQGLSSAKRNAYAVGQLDSATVSSVIEPEYQRIIGELTEDQRQLGSFSVYDRLGHNLMVFSKDGNVIVYTSNDKLNYKAWSSYTEMDWTAGCTSLLGRVFLCKGTRIFQLGNNTFGEKYHADRMLDRDKNWAVSTNFTLNDLVYDTVDEQSYKCLVTHTSSVFTFAQDRQNHPDWWVLYEGNPIAFELEMPWFDGKDPMKVKHLRFLSVGTKGTAEFQVEVYVDNFYKNVDGAVIYNPALSITLIGNEAPGFGEDAGPFGGGRRSHDPRLTNYPAKFKTAKFRIVGSAMKPLSIINFSFLFAKGRYFR